MLRDYSHWIGKSALTIRQHVILNGGWTAVFPAPTDLPKWAHRLRNFFNEPPKRLLRMGDFEAKRARQQITLKNQSTKNTIAAMFAASGDVYTELKSVDGGDAKWDYWIEMSQAGSKYHSKEGLNEVESAVLPHSFTGNFKLVCPDGTGGSSETALHNWRTGILETGKRSKAEVGEWVNGVTQAILDDQYRGSYNYADTMDAGYDEHERLDMDTDKKYGTKYINEGRWAAIGDRVFRDFVFD